MKDFQDEGLLHHFCGPLYDADLDRDELLHELFEETVQHYPGKTAVESGSVKLTYRELDCRANQLAHYLRDIGVGREDRVALLLPKTEFVYVAMLGVLKAGAAYVPLDPAYPTDRVGFIVQDCAAKVCITEAALLEALGGEIGDTPVFLADRDGPGLTGQPDTPLGREQTGLDRQCLCYVIYTSGTTGRPKGCLIEHRNICNLVRSEAKVYGITGEDRVFQCASTAFDASLEEIWMAFRHGATLVAGTKEIMRTGPMLGQALSQRGVTVLSCVPTLLSMIEGDIDTMRILIVGGEACPKDLAARWHRPTRTIFNSYGPTEATVAATYGVLVPNRPVTIGQALPNYRCYILDDKLDPVPPGAEGELYIGGSGVARGYLNRDDLTRERFITTERVTGEPERLYRTGDLARFTEDGDIDYLGRADDQVKVRGYRIELSEIEAVLMQCPGVQCAAVTMWRETGQLAAYVVARQGASMSLGFMRETVAKRLPPYMMPATLDVIAALPLLTSGKVNRKALPAPVEPFEDRDRPVTAPRNQVERDVAGVWEEVFKRKGISVTDDFFLDLGGHSLFAAVMVSKLRHVSGFAGISVGDVYQHPTIESLATLGVQGAAASKPAPAQVFREIPPARHFACACAQLLAVVVLAGLYAWQWLGPFFTSAYLVLDHWALGPSLLAGLLVYAVSYPLLLAVVVLAKWLILGRIKPGKHPLWGWYYFRFWFVRQLSRAVAIKYLAGSPLICLYYRLLGAKVGRDVFIGTAGLMTFDLLTVGDGASIGYDSSVDGSWVEDGQLHLASVTIGANCFVGNRSVLGPNTVMRDNSGLADLSMLPEGGVIPSGSLYGGTPAAPVGTFEDVPAPRTWSFGYGLCFVLGVFLFPLLVEGAIFPGLMFMEVLDNIDPYYWWLLYAPVVGISFILLICLEIALFKWVFLPRMKEGRYPLRGWFYWRKWFFTQLMQVSLEILGTLYSTLYLKPWFFVLGARLGKGSEISTVRHVNPEFLVAGAACFLADDVMIGAPGVRGGAISIGYVHVGDKTFVGNSALVPGGMVLGDGALIGCLSTTPAANPVPTGTSWFGSPAIHLPRRQEAERFSEAQTYAPPRRLVLLRCAIEFFRVTLPLTLFVVLATMIMNVVDMYQDWLPLWMQIASLPFLYLGSGVAALLLVAGLKWVVVGRYRESNHPLWCGFVWRTELVTGVYENFGTLFMLDLLRGTPFIRWPLRLLGMRVGPRCYLDSTWFTEFDLVEIGEEAALNEDANLQTHLFEDRVMKVGRVVIGKRCTVGMKATVLYDTCLEDNVSLGDLSLLMKGETLPRETKWQGAPARRVG
jgi:non-ribosomal peptide synthetase-like protein